jgi:hypothetical protein
MFGGNKQNARSSASIDLSAGAGDTGTVASGDGGAGGIAEGSGGGGVSGTESVGSKKRGSTVRGTIFVVV